MLISREDFAKYPFSKRASTYVKDLDLRVNELAHPEYIRVVVRAEQRINEALISGIVGAGDFLESEIEILSFPVAVLFVAKIDDSFLERRYALAEARRASELLRGEKDEKLVELAETSFQWNVRTEDHKFFLNLVDYLRNSADSLARDDRWKLVNRIMVRGEVLLHKEEFTRLLQEEIQRHIIHVVESSPRVDLHDSLVPVVERIRQMLVQRRAEIRGEELPKRAISTAYPPCIKRLYDFLLAGQHISHMGRFTLTSFLLSVGIQAEELVRLYTAVSDFNEQQTRYQVEHIAGEKGSRIKYTPPNCNTLKTHGLCIGADDLCATVRHPLTYYRRKIRRIKELSADRNE